MTSFLANSSSSADVGRLSLRLTSACGTEAREAGPVAGRLGATIKQSGKISKMRRMGVNQGWCGVLTTTLTTSARSELAALHSKIPTIVARLEIAEDFA